MPHSVHFQASWWPRAEGEDGRRGCHRVALDAGSRQHLLKRFGLKVHQILALRVLVLKGRPQRGLHCR